MDVNIFILLFACDVIWKPRVCSAFSLKLIRLLQTEHHGRKYRYAGIPLSYGICPNRPTRYTDMT